MLAAEDKRERKQVKRERDAFKSWENKQLYSVLIPYPVHWI